MSVPDTVTKSDLDSYVVLLFDGIIENYDNLLEAEKDFISDYFGDAWELFVTDSDKMSSPDLIQFMLKTYAGPLWTSKQASFSISGSYSEFYKITEIPQTAEAVSNLKRLSVGGAGSILYGYGNDKDFSIGGDGVGTGTYRGISSDFTVNFKDFFYHISPKDIKGEEARKVLYRLSESGLLDLLFYKPKVQDFARKRYVSKDALQKSALEYVDEYGEDLDWLAALTRTYNIIIKDPISAWLMSRYFPNLAEYIFTALAATADYSNNGFGGSTKDPLNDPIEMAKRMFKAFGTDVNGDAIFKPAWTLINTAMRIEAALAEFPFRNNIPPRPPDIFHLRLGAANFYVPPVTINVNSMFKTGSLTGRSNQTKKYSEV